MQAWVVVKVISVLVPGACVLYMLSFSSSDIPPLAVCWSTPIMGNYSLGASFYVDSLSITFSLVLCLVAYQAFSYCLDYMSGAKGNSLFFLSLGVFILSMQLLIFSGDLLGVFLAWDGLGISSFLLVAFYMKSSAQGGSLITVGVNRLGDAFLCLTLASVFTSGDFYFWGAISPGISSVMFSVAAFSKSAQWPFSAWLPAAMAAPTPISALVHSSTLVTAGIYLLMRGESFLQGGMMWALTGSFTFFSAAVAACLTYDLKRLIAMSTLGHLGFMITCLGSGQSHLGATHLFSHALFKSSLFMGAGDMIDCHGHSQDLRDMSAVWQRLPLSSHGFFFSLLSLAGIPFTGGFFSKGAGLQAIVVGSSVAGSICGIICSMGLVASSGYCARSAYYLFFSTQGISPEWLDMDYSAYFSNNSLWFAVSGLGLDFILGSAWKLSVDHADFCCSAIWEMSMILLGASVAAGMGWWDTENFPTSLEDFNRSLHIFSLRSMYRLVSGMSLSSSLGGMRDWEQGTLEVLGPQGGYEFGMVGGGALAKSTEW